MVVRLLLSSFTGLSLFPQNNISPSFSSSSQKSSLLLPLKNNISPVCLSKKNLLTFLLFQPKKSLLCFRKIIFLSLPCGSPLSLYDNTPLYEILSFLYMEYSISFFFFFPLTHVDGLLSYMAASLSIFPFLSEDARDIGRCIHVVHIEDSQGCSPRLIW